MQRPRPILRGLRFAKAPQDEDIVASRAWRLDSRLRAQAIGNERVGETHVLLFDGSNSGIALKDAPALSIQHHPEASPGPQDSFYIFKRFVERLKAA